MADLGRSLYGSSRPIVDRRRAIIKYCKMLLYVLPKLYEPCRLKVRGSA
jgi:hypothetical protein